MDGPFGGRTGLKIRVAALLLFAGLAALFLALENPGDAARVGVFGVIGVFETLAYRRRLPRQDEDAEPVT